MAIAEEDFGHSELVGGGVTTLHSHPGNVDVRSGVIINVTDGSFGIVQFAADPANRFANSPHVVLTLHGTSLAVDIPILSYVTTNSFEWNIHKGHGGTSHTWNIYWIATDAGSL
ncbi:hypothetical protein LCGC14_1360800 [marine sediment metagenome]|uniref:H-type lectin domain-containing protein n=1 Tax=marine sediment metagenome TaxID=412755 RepID=A0A0F9KU89_9ZZZZ